MTPYRVGQTFVFDFQTKNASGQLYDPVTVQVSDLKPAGEDVLTYGGTSPRDAWLTKLSTGNYRVKYTLDVAGEHHFSKRWSDDSFETDYRGEERAIQVLADTHDWIDSPVGPTGTHYIYSGVGAAGITDPTTLEAMTRTETTTYANTFTVSPSSQKVYFCHPVSWGPPVITLDGLAIDELTPSTVTMHDYGGTTVDYLVHETTNLLTGTGLDFVVNF